MRCWGSILDWINLCWASGSYAEPYIEIFDEDDEEARPKIRSPRRKELSEEEQEKVRFHGEIDVVLENANIANAE